MSKQLLQAAALLATVPMAAAQSVEVFVDPGAGAPQTFGNGTDDAMPPATFPRSSASSQPPSRAGSSSSTALATSAKWVTAW